IDTLRLFYQQQTIQLVADVFNSHCELLRIRKAKTIQKALKKLIQSIRTSCTIFEAKPIPLPL
ncbi:hypothetical protein, partial [Priestia megaterium]|uniref:hypothetical protein n=1 Tax=Priestia megaterium TaxID=1404 RepID=UPI003241E497